MASHDPATLSQSIGEPFDLIDPNTRSMSRRGLLQTVAGAGMGLSIASLAGGAPVFAGFSKTSGSAMYVVTHFQSLHAKPSHSSKSLLTLPNGAHVQRIGGGTADYWKVVYQDHRGYTYGAALAPASTGNLGSTDEAVLAVTTDAVNHRSAPSSSADVYAVIPAGTQVGIIPDGATNGYLPTYYGGRWGWAYAAFIARS